MAGSDPITRPEVDRIRRISLRLGGPECVSAHRAAEEVIRLHQVIDHATYCLDHGYPEAAMEALRPEVDESWVLPLEVVVPYAGVTPPEGRPSPVRQGEGARNQAGVRGPSPAPASLPDLPVQGTLFESEGAAVESQGPRSGKRKRGGSKVAHVLAAGQTRPHACHWPGCQEQVPPAMFMCRPHWFKLPEAIRDRIWAAYVPGQEERIDPSDEYLEAAQAAQDWILANHPPAKSGA